MIKARWTEDNDAILAQMWIDGASAHEISTRLGGELNGFSPAAVRNRASVRARTDRRFVRRRASNHAGSRHLIYGTSLLPDFGMCAWIYGEGNRRSLCSCKAVLGRPYCAAHCEIAYEPDLEAM